MRKTKIMMRTTRFLILVVLRPPTFGSNVATLPVVPIRATLIPATRWSYSQQSFRFLTESGNLEYENGRQKVMEHDKLAKSHGIL